MRICLLHLSPMVETAIKDLGVKTPVVKMYNPVLIEQWKRTPKIEKWDGRCLAWMKMI
jgi:hypothetical protein